MKTIDKKAVMKRAWKIFKGNSRYSDNFSESLKRAWWVEKENAKQVRVKYEYFCGKLRTEEEMRVIREEMNAPRPVVDYSKHIANHYATAPAGTYFGD